MGDKTSLMVASIILGANLAMLFVVACDALSGQLRQSVRVVLLAVTIWVMGSVLCVLKIMDNL